MDQQPLSQSKIAGGLPQWFRARPLLCALVLVALTVLAYAPALDGGFVFDDSVYLTEDGRMETLSGLADIWTEVGGPDYQHQYYPLTSSAFWVQYQLWGDRPAGYHLVNVLLHALNAVLLWRLLGRLSLPAAWLAAAVFAVHPVHVQSVAWISELKNVLSTAFFLSSILLFVRYLGLVASRSSPGWMTYAVGLALFVCALLSKTATCLLPVALLLVVWWKRGGVDRRSLMAVGPLAVLGAAFVVMTVYLESHHGGARGEVFSQTWLERVLIAGRALWFYAGKLAWPVDLVFIYPRWTIDVTAWGQYLFPLAAAAVLIALWGFQDRVGRGAFASVGFFVAALVPISLVNVAYTRLSFVSDHWAYWASMGMIALVVGAAAGHERMRAMWSKWWVGMVAPVLILGVLSSLTWRRATVYESPMTLWSDTLARNPQAWAAHNNLGLALAEAGLWGPAMEHYGEALRLYPTSAKANYNMANALERQGCLEEAIAHYRRALGIDADYADAHYNLGNALRQAGDPDAAIRQYRLAVRVDPGFAMAHCNLGAALLNQGRHEEAIVHCQQALRLEPGLTGARHNLGLALAAQGRAKQAPDHARQAAAVGP
ncbi:MAG: tetratricopeptide repeat protein [Planctomycetota bacterium]|jgi:tetratricopeptide (TPR) repeat protein